MELLLSQYSELNRKARNIIKSLIKEHGQKSKFSNTKVLPIEDESFQYYLTKHHNEACEISKDGFIDTDGWPADFDSVTDHEFFYLVDYLNAKYNK